MPFGRIFGYMILISALGFSIQASANSSDSQVAAESQGIGVAISNWTSFTINTQFNEGSGGDGIVGPGFPLTILPYQNTGTGVYLRGGPASNYYVSMDYEIANGDAILPSFGIQFTADTQWDVKAAASDVLHAVKKKVTSNAKDSLKKTAADTGEDALEAAGAADGMTEVYAALKVMEDIAKLFKALDPSYQMTFVWYPTAVEGGDEIPFWENACISRNENTPAPANVAIVGPDEPPTAENKDEFFILSAGRSVIASTPCREWMFEGLSFESCGSACIATGRGSCPSCICQTGGVSTGDAPGCSCGPECRHGTLARDGVGENSWHLCMEECMQVTHFMCVYVRAYVRAYVHTYICMCT